MKRIILFSLILLAGLYASAQNHDIRKEKFTPFYTIEKVLPEPSEYTYALDTLDSYDYQTLEFRTMMENAQKEFNS